MLTFQYLAIDREGLRIHAREDALDANALEQNLESRGLTVVEIKAVRGILGRTNASGESSNESERTGSVRRRKVTRRELIEFCIYMASLTDAGISILVALRDYANECSNPYLEYVVLNHCRAVEAGSGLSETMSQTPDVFSQEFIQLVKAGERTGTISRSFQELRKYLEWRERLAGDVKQATTYPLVITVVLGSFVLYLFSVVIPSIAVILVDMKIALPTITRVVLACSNFAVHTWWIWVILAVGAPIGFKQAQKRSEVFAYWIDGLMMHVPILGPLLRMIIQSRFTQNFSVLHRAGIPILENLDLCVGLVGNRLYERAIQQAGADIREGSTLSASLRSSELFNGLVIRMIAVGENTGSLDTSLRNASEYFDQEVPRRIKKVFAIFEPAIILTLVAVVGVVALAIFMPILSIQGGLK